MKNSRRKILVQIPKNSAIYRPAGGYIAAFAVIALLIFLFEPGIKTYGNSL